MTEEKQVPKLCPNCSSKLMVEDIYIRCVCGYIESKESGKVIQGLNDEQERKSHISVYHDETGETEFLEGFVDAPEPKNEEPKEEKAEPAEEPKAEPEPEPKAEPEPVVEDLPEPVKEEKEEVVEEKAEE